MAYYVGNLPADTDPAVVRELRKIQEVLNAAVDGHVYRTLYAEPARLVEGLTVKADGTTWSPGGTGAGLYQYRAGAWVKLG